MLWVHVEEFYIYLSCSSYTVIEGYVAYETCFLKDMYVAYETADIVNITVDQKQYF